MSIDHEEILRLRDRYHTLVTTAAALELQLEVINLRLEALEQHRRVYDPKVDVLMREREIKEAVRERSKVELTWIQRTGALVLFVLTSADLLSRLVS